MKYQVSRRAVRVQTFRLIDLYAKKRFNYGQWHDIQPSVGGIVGLRRDVM